MSWIDAEKAFAEHFERYEPRHPQRLLAEHIEGALSDGVTIMAEAPTGTGKSFAAMVPAIDHARATGRPVCAATGTKNLQDQYIKDMETLKAIYLPDLKYVVLKGRSNYVCRAQIADLRKNSSPIDVDAIIEAAEQPGVDGDVERLGFPLAPLEKAAVTISTDECPGKKSCPFGETCFAERVKTQATTADVVIANHALLAIDAVLKVQGIAMLPDFSALVIDEAHEFENYVSNALSTRVTERSITLLASQVSDFTGKRDLVGATNVAAKLFFDRLRRVMDNRESQRESTVAITPAILLELEDELGNLLRAINKLDGALALTRAATDDESLKRRRLRKRTVTLLEKVSAVAMADFADMIRWIELETRKRSDGYEVETLALMQSPLEVGPFLAQAVWPAQAAALVSATLAVGTDFSYLAGRLGLTDYESFQCESPFDYAKQAVTFTPRDMPDPVKRDERDAFRAAVVLNIAELVRAADGRALLLFTSWAGLNDAYRVLNPLIQGMGHTVLKQGDAPSRVLADQFKNDEHSVLFAVKSLFTGVDIQGDSLRLLVIDKLPFPVPSVLFAAQCAAIDARVGRADFMKGSFMTRQVPEMTITLTQAIGRLIRSQSDRGLVAILDPRLHTKPSYGRRTIKAIQTAFPSPVVTDLREAVAYLESLEEGATV